MLIAGIDEAGSGPLAGPVFAAAVILDPARPIRGLRDSKVLTAERRDELAAEIRLHAIAWAVASADVAEIDTLNILQATLLAMRRAVEALARRADGGAGRRQPLSDARLHRARDRQGRPRRRVDLGRVDPREDRARRACWSSSTRCIRSTASRATRATARPSIWPRSRATARARSTGARSRRWRRYDFRSRPKTAFTSAVTCQF